MNPLFIPIVGSLATKVLDRLIASPNTTVTQAEAPAVRQEVANAVAPVIEHLTNNEPWTQSRVTWGALGSILAGLSTLAMAVGNGELSFEIAGPALLGIGGGFVALYGRWRARKPLGA